MPPSQQDATRQENETTFGKIRSHINVAIMYLERGDPKSAESLGDEALAEWKQVAGISDDLVLLQFKHLIETWKSRKDMVKLKVLKSILEHFDVILGKDHTAAQSMAITLVDLYINQGELPDAEKMMQERMITYEDLPAGTLAGYQKMLGERDLC
jgi:hypothetical protein